MKLTKIQKNNISAWLIYTIGIYLVLIPLKIWLIAIPISIIIGFFFGLLNTIIIQLRKLNGEKFPNLEEPKEKKDELLKS